MSISLIKKSITTVGKVSLGLLGLLVSSHLGPSCVPQYILAPLSRI